MNQLTTVFSEHMDKTCVLPEYPRPNLQRESYINLNGLWEYAFTKSNDKPEKFDGTILVPFSPETYLSGVHRILQPEEYLWYYRELPLLSRNKEDRVILHFGAVDQYAKVFVNDQFVTDHMGGYLPFMADITEYLKEEKNTLLVLVQDVTDTSYHSRGKQTLTPGGMFYTSQSGIWQTVWIECVPKVYIKELKVTPNLDESKVEIQITLSENERVKGTLTYYDDEKAIGEISLSGVKVITTEICLEKVKPWSPEFPHLYPFTITIGEDKVESYFAMRKYSLGKDEKGITRLFLNNKAYFHNGLLDQGYWPESLYTAPTDEALLYDIKIAKELGFNMLRKHAKVEPLRWYYHCDKIGMLVWQDMVNGGTTYNSNFVTYFPNITPFLANYIKDTKYQWFSRRDEEGKVEYKNELRDMITALYHFASIAMWVPFNEGWGQFDSLEIVKEIRKLDTSRTIDHASGWFDQGGGDVKSLHIYFTPFIFIAEKKRAVVLSEFGGYVYRVKGHDYSNKSYGYRTYKSQEDFTKAYKKLYDTKIIPNKNKCLSAAVYTQLTDIEEEINGLLTYDRKVIKLDGNIIKEINKGLQ